MICSNRMDIRMERTGMSSRGIFLRLTRREWSVIGILTVIGTILVVLSLVGGETLVGILSNFGVGLVSAVIIFIILELVLEHIHETAGHAERGFNYKEWVDQSKRSKKQLRVLNTFTELLIESGRYDLEKQRFLAYLRSFAVDSEQEDFTMQFLFLDPYSQAAEQRQIDRQKSSPYDHDKEKNTEDTINVIQAIKDNLSTLYYLKQDLGAAGKRIEVKLFYTLPPFQLFQLDKAASITYYPRQRGTSDIRTLRFDFSIETPLGDFVRSTFEEIWQDGDATKTLEDYMQIEVVVNKEGVHSLSENAHFLKTRGQDLYTLFFESTDNTDSKLLAAMFSAISGDVDIVLKWRSSKAMREVKCSVKEIVNNLPEFSAAKQVALSKYGSRFRCDHIFELEGIP